MIDPQHAAPAASGLPRAAAGFLAVLSAVMLALAVPATLFAQTLAGTPIKAPGGYLPGIATYCDNGSGVAVICSGGGGGTPTGTAGTPTTQVVSVQGVSGGTPLPISGSITATNPSVAATGVAVPGAATYLAASLGGTLTGLTASANGLKVDGSAVTQPVSGTVTANIGAIGTLATAANQTNVQSAPGASAATALTVQGSASGVAIPVDGVVRGAATDRGATVGTTALTLMAANTARRGMAVQVQSATANCWINGAAAATADFHSLKIPANTYYESAPTHSVTGAISIVCDTAATAVYAREW